MWNSLRASHIQILFIANAESGYFVLLAFTSWGFVAIFIFHKFSFRVKTTRRVWKRVAVKEIRPGTWIQQTEMLNSLKTTHFSILFIENKHSNTRISIDKMCYRSFFTTTAFGPRPTPWRLFSRLSCFSWLRLWSATWSLPRFGSFTWSFPSITFFWFKAAWFCLSSSCFSCTTHYL
jgi:hypothetical protein